MKRAWTVLVFAIAAVSLQAANLLPEFGVVAHDGRPFSSRDFSAKDRWLLIYVAPACASCDAILGVLSELEPLSRPERVVVILAGNVTQTLALASRFPALTRADWYADPGGAAGQMLKVPMRPTVIGLQHDAIEWTLPFATHPDRAALDVRPLLANWLQPPQH